MPRSSLPLAVSAQQQERIERWLAALGTAQQVALRCRIVLAASSGKTELQIASALNVNRKTVRLWRDRFTREGLRAGYGRSRRAADVSQPMSRTVSRRSSTQLCNRSRKGARIGAAGPWRPIRVLVSRRSITSCAVTISSRIAPGLSSCRAPPVSGETYRRGRALHQSAGQGDRPLRR